MECSNCGNRYDDESDYCPRCRAKGLQSANEWPGPDRGLRQRGSFVRLLDDLPAADPVGIQRRSFEWFMGPGLEEVFREMPTITDVTGNTTLQFAEHSFGDPFCAEEEARGLYECWSAPLFVDAHLMSRVAEEIKVQSVFLGDVPLVTQKGTFIFGGTERVVLNQLVPRPGVYFEVRIDEETGKALHSATIVPHRGAWLELEIDKTDTLSARIDRRGRWPARALLEAIGDEPTEMAAFLEGEGSTDTSGLEESTGWGSESLAETFRRQRLGEPLEKSFESLLNKLCFDEYLYDLSRFGREELNRKLGLTVRPGVMVLTQQDIIETVRCLLKLHFGAEGCEVNDIYHPRDRRVRTVGEMLQDQFRIGLSRMKPTIRERMAVGDWESMTPQNLVNIRPIVMAIRDFFERGCRGEDARHFVVVGDESDELLSGRVCRNTNDCGEGIFLNCSVSEDVADFN